MFAQGSKLFWETVGPVLLETSEWWLRVLQREGLCSVRTSSEDLGL